MSKQKGWVRHRNPSPKKEDPTKKAEQRLRTLSYFGCNPNAVVAAKKAAEPAAPKDPLLANFYHRQQEQQLAAQQHQQLHQADYDDDAWLDAPPPPVHPAVRQAIIPPPSRYQQHSPPTSRGREVGPRRQDTVLRRQQQPLQRPMTRPVPTTSHQRPGMARIESHDERYERDLRSRMVGSAAWSNAVRPLRI